MTLVNFIPKTSNITSYINDFSLLHFKALVEPDPTLGDDASECRPDPFVCEGYGRSPYTPG